MKQNIKTICLIVLLFCTTSLKWATAQDCIPDDPRMEDSTLFINDVVDDTYREVLATFTVIGITAADVLDTEYMEVEVSVEDQTVSVFPSDEFENYEENTISDGQPQILFQIELTCDETKHTITFNQPLTDINNHAPVFLQSQYVYRIPMPFPSQIEITQYGEDLIARDIDITNNDMTFYLIGINSDYFTFIPGGTVDDLLKNYKSTLIARRPFEFRTTQTFILRATDSGTPSQSNVASLVIEVDEENSVIRLPSFSQGLYEVDYEEILYAAESPFAMLITDGESATFSFSSYTYNIEHVYQDGALLIWLSNGFEDDDLELGGSRQIIITATVSDLKFSTTVLNVILPEASLPAFVDAYYDVDYAEFPRTEENALRLAITNAESATYSFSLYETNLGHSYEAGELLIWLANEFEDDDLQLAGIRQIVITATVSELRSTKTVLTVTLPIVAPLFSDAHYEVDYEEFPRTEEDALRLAITNAESATYSFSLYEPNLGYSYEAGELLIWLANEFDDDDLQLAGIRQIVITATVSDLRSTKTVLTVTLPIVENAPLFSDAHYDVDYEEFPRTEEDALRLAITNAESATYSFSLYETNLGYSYEAGELLIWLANEFDDDDLQLAGIRQIVITATVSDLRSTKTVLTVTLPIVAPLFSDAHYEVDYEEFPRTEEDALRLAITNAESANYSFSLYETNLGHSYETGELLIWLANEFDDDDLQLAGIRQIVITATVSELRSTRTVLIVTLPIVENAPLFSDAHYDVDYEEFPRTKEDALRLAITNAESATYSFSLYETNFEHSNEASELLIWLAKELDDDDLQLAGIRQIVITATVSEMSTTRTVLTLILPVVDATDSEFKETGYIAGVSVVSALLLLFIVGFVVFYYFKLRKSKTNDHNEERGDRRSTPQPVELPEHTSPPPSSTQRTETSGF